MKTGSEILKQSRCEERIHFDGGGDAEEFSAGENEVGVMTSKKAKLKRMMLTMTIQVFTLQLQKRRETVTSCPLVRHSAPERVHVRVRVYASSCLRVRTRTSS